MNIVNNDFLQGPSSSLADRQEKERRVLMAEPTGSARQFVESVCLCPKCIYEVISRRMNISVSAK